MKQRLLLVLLALFTSIGLARVQAADPGNGIVKLTIPKGNTVTISFNNGGAVGTAYYTIGSTNEATITGIGTNGSSLSISADESHKNAASYTAAFYSGSYTSMTIGTGATSIELSGNYDWPLKTLSIASGNLTSIALGKAHANLESLTINSNKLLNVPTKTDKMKTYSISVQSPKLELNTNAGWIAANKGLDVSLDKLLGAAGSSNGIYKDPYTLKNWKHTTNSAWNNTAHKGSADINRYYFYVGTNDTYQEGYEYVDGEYTCTIEFLEGSSHPGLKIEGVPVKVLPAEYEAESPTILPELTGTNVAGKLSFQPAYSGTITKGDKFTVKANPNAGYSIDLNGIKGKTKGFDIVEKESGLYEFTVNGKATPSITAEFKAAGQPITIAPVSNGVLTVLNGTTTVNDGASIPTGTELTIKATPNPGYKVDKVLVNNEPQNAINIDGQVYTYKYTVTAANEATIISASFKPAELKLTMQWTEADMNLVLLDAGKGTGTSDNGKYTKEWLIPYGTKPTISLQTIKNVYITSIIANNEPVDFKVTKAQEETGTVGTTYQITYFDMQSKDVTMIVNTSGKSKAKIIVAFDDETGTYNGDDLVYDGTEKTIPYETNPANLSGVIIKYYEKGKQEVASTKGFINAGTYKAEFIRESDNIFESAVLYNKNGKQKTNDNNVINFTIKAATPVITTDPSVSIDKETGEYKITAGVARYKKGSSMETIPSNKCVWEVVNGDDVKKKTSLNADDKGNYASEVVTVRLHIKKNANEDWSPANTDTNFETEATISVKAKGQTDEVESVKVYVLTSLMPEGTSLTMRNGNKEFGTSATVLSGTHISFTVNPGRYTSDQWGVYQVDKQGNKKNNSDNDINAIGIDATGTEMYFLLIPKVKLEDLIELALISANDEVTNGTPNHTYNGKVHNFKTDVIKVKNKATGKTVTGVNWSNATITYKEDKTNQVTTAPINAGFYTVTIKRAADNTYKEFTATGTMYIEQETPTIVKWPNTEENDPAYIGEGQALSTAVLTGGVASVEGHFDWITPDKIIKVDGLYDIKFVSEDPNYKDVSSSTDKSIKAYVKITNQSILSIAKDNTYTITAKGSDGKTYTNGMTVPVGTTLTFTVTPASGYRLNTLYVNGKAISGNTYKTTAGPVSVKAMMVREYTITLGSAPRGVKIASKPSSNVVVAGGSYTFTLNHVSGDKPTVTGTSNISVSTSGSTTTVKVTNIQANATLSIALANPTAIKITTKETLSKAGKPMGTIRVTGVNSSNECYYGDKITVTATANPGVEFAGWEGLTSTENPYEFEATNATYIFQAKYHGTLTGIESVDELKYYGGDGYIFVNCPAQGTLTIISMNGRAQKMSVSGQTRVTVPAGVYGIVLTSGSEVVRDKVVVR